MIKKYFSLAILMVLIAVYGYLTYSAYRTSNEYKSYWVRAFAPSHFYELSYLRGDVQTIYEDEQIRLKVRLP